MNQILKISNFKAFEKEQAIRIAPVTLILGQNSAGKSSIIQSLLLLNQSFKSIDAADNFELSTKGENFDLGIPSTFFHKSKTDKFLVISSESNISLRFFEKIEDNKIVDDLIKNYNRIEVRLYYKQQNTLNPQDPVKLHKIEYRIKNISGNDPKFISLVLAEDGKNEYKLENIKSAEALSKFINQYHELFSSQFKKFKNYISDKKSTNIIEFANILLNIKFGSYRFSGGGLPGFDIDNKELMKFERLQFFWGTALDILNHPILQVFKNIQHIAGLRNSPQRYYPLNNARAYVGKNGENTATLLYKQAKNIKVINAWFKLLEIPYKISVSPITDNLAGSLLIIKLIDIRNKTELTPSDVGLGVSQVLPLLVQGLADSGKEAAAKGSIRLRCVEQPELHLHPKLQANLADFFIDTTTRNNKLRWILETHSESLILRIQRRIKEGRIKPEDISINYVNSIKGGHSVIKELRLDSDGDFIDEWPDGFFEESFNERFITKI
jgi:predicted ATPase